ncbi:MAG TPA: acetyl-CoA carboxylase biotin carboxylase subunit [Dehalococcoidia bacterium]
MFKKLLVANRGEITIRVLRACRELGIPGVAVYSEADRGALHVRYADEAYCIGPAPALESYLNIPRIIEAAQRAGADAIHPGYGFLSENAAFAAACREAGITFVGPSPEAMRLLGDKVEARRVMRGADVPIAPGTDFIEDPAEAVRAAEEIGYPVLIKAAAGGGGRGIRVVNSRQELDQALETARQEALSAFGNAGVFVEKYLDRVRHVEVQFIADRHGTVVALGERDCSVQRRHQKLVEEAPSPAVTPEIRRRLCEAAARGARAAGYENAGTMEFLLDRDGNFYFLEVNTRLQVEHPVTELVTGVDLVVDQIRVAAGEPLGYTQDDVKMVGHAIECRIVAEDPYNNFLPSVGTITFVREPAGPGIRMESALFQGMEVSVYYDSMIAKLIAWGADRDQAIRRAHRALTEFKVLGVHTNIPFHLQLLEDERFRRGDVHTKFLEQEFRLERTLPTDGIDAAFIAAAVLAAERDRRGLQLQAGTNGTAPAAGWRAAGRVAQVRGGIQYRGMGWR